MRVLTKNEVDLLKAVGELDVFGIRKHPRGEGDYFFHRSHGFNLRNLILSFGNNDYMGHGSTEALKIFQKIGKRILTEPLGNVEQILREGTQNYDTIRHLNSTIRGPIIWYDICQSALGSLITAL